MECFFAPHLLCVLGVRDMRNIYLFLKLIYSVFISVNYYKIIFHFYKVFFKVYVEKEKKKKKKIKKKKDYKQTSYAFVIHNNVYISPHTKCLYYQYERFVIIGKHNFLSIL